MGNYCNGTATLSGNKDTLNQIYVLCQRLEDCAAVSGFDADEEWLPHIFTTEVTEDGIFSEGCSFQGDKLELYVKVSRGTGRQFFADMAEALGVSVVWDFVSDADDKQYVYTYAPTGRSRLKWTLRSEESLDEDEDGESDSSHYAGRGVSTMHLGAAHNAPYVYSAETVECLGNLKSLLQEYHTAFVRGADFKTASSCERLMQLLTKMQQYGPSALEEAREQLGH